MNIEEVYENNKNDREALLTKTTKIALYYTFFSCEKYISKYNLTFLITDIEKKKDQ